MGFAYGFYIIHEFLYLDYLLSQLCQLIYKRVFTYIFWFEFRILSSCLIYPNVRKKTRE